MTPADEIGAAGEIRLVVSSRAEVIGGAEQSLATLLRNLDERFAVSLVTAVPEVAEFLASHRRARSTVVVPRDGAPDGISNLRRLRAAFAAADPHIVHVNRAWIWDRPIDILAGALTRGGKVVVVEHTQSLPSKSSRQRAFRRFLTGRIDAAVSVSDAAARQSEASIGLAPGTVRTIHNGVEPLPPVPTDRPLGSPVTIGAVGRLSWEKGYEDLPAVLRDLPEARLLLVGDGPDRVKLESLAAAAGLADRFELAGWQTDVSAWIPRFDVLVAPSRGEGSPPLAALQAMMAGVPVVATDVGGVPEAIVDRVTGMLVPPGDPAAMASAVGALLADDDLRHRVVEAARERVDREFTAAAMARRFERLYAEINPALPDFSAAPAPAA
jgi:glycosyltransferase involved in cell wall biosynthesis